MANDLVVSFEQEKSIDESRPPVAVTETTIAGFTVPLVQLLGIAYKY